MPSVQPRTTAPARMVVTRIYRFVYAESRFAKMIFSKMPWNDQSGDRIRIAVTLDDNLNVLKPTLVD